MGFLRDWTWVIVSMESIFWNLFNKLLQQLSLNHHGVREKLGLPKKVDPVPTSNREEMDTPVETQAGQPRQQDKIPLEDLSPRELLAVSPLNMIAYF